MLSPEKQADAICDRVRLLKSDFDKCLSRHIKEEEAVRIAAECDNVALEIFPLMGTERILSLALLDVALVGIPVNSMLCRWDAVVAAGMQLVGAVTAMRRWSSSGDLGIETELELGRLIGARFDETLYAIALVEKPSIAGWLCDVILSGGYGARQAVEASEYDIRKTWERSNSRLRIPIDDPNMGHVKDAIQDAWKMFKWGFRAIKGLRRAQSSSQSLRSAGYNDDAIWSNMLQAVEETDRFSDDAQRWVYMQGVACSTPYAAKVTDRDIIYLAAGSRGGAAFRFYGGSQYQRKPEILILPDADLNSVRGIRRAIDNMVDLESDDEYVEVMNTIHQQVGDLIVSPILQRWSDLSSISLVPVGAMQGLPYSSSKVTGRRFSEILDVTIAPTAKTLILATSQDSTSSTSNGVIVGDPSTQHNYLEKVPVEVNRVAAVYGKDPDLLISYSENDTAYSGAHSNDDIIKMMSSGDIVHLACHGSEPRRRKAPTLVIGNGISYKDFEYHVLKSGARVVLSSCWVALDSIEAPLAHLGFPTMLLSAGASSVIACSWPVPDSLDTVDFMVDLHRHLAKGLTASQALRSAVDNAIKKDVSPEVWSAFEAYGR